MKYGSLKVATSGEIRDYPLDLPSLVVGRASSSDIVLDDISIARRHARLSFDSGRFFVEDLGSASGTFIDAYRVDPGVPALAGPGQELRFGDVVAWYEAAEVEDMATAAPTAPVDSFDTAIRGSLTSPLDPLEPGGAARVAVLSLVNRGRIVDDFAITVSGLPPEWLTLSAPSVSLLPGDAAEVHISISPPRHEFSEAGIYDFSVTISSGQGGREVVLPGKVEVTAFRDVAWTLSPVRAKRDFRVIATNRGNSRQVYRLEGEDDEASLRYDFQQPALDLPPGGEGSVAFRVAPRRKPWFGAPSVRAFKVNATSVEDEAVRGTALGQVLINPPLQPVKRGAMFALMFCIAIAVVVLAVIVPDALFGGDGGTKIASAEEAFKGVHLCDDEGKAAEQQKAAEQLAVTGPPAPQGATAANLGAPFYAQNDPRWGDVEYAKAKDPEFGPDWCGSTIAQCGCAMTSVATMLAIYGVLETPDGVPLSPQSLNEWFNKNARRTNRGWVSQGYIYGDVIWTAANQLSGELAAKKPGTRTVRFVRTGTGSEEEIREQLQLGRPVVLEVPGHWIAATGLVGDKIQINDPFYRDRTTLDAYKGKVRSSVLFEPSEDLSAVVITVPADVRVRVTDKDGHEVGTLNTGSREDAAKAAKNEIPGASYSTRKAWRDPTCIQKAPTSDEGTNQIVLPGRREDYKIEVLDTAGGATNVAIHTYDRTGQPTVQVLENAGAVTASLAFDPEKPSEIKVVAGQQPTAAGSASASPSASPASPTAAVATPTPPAGALKPGETNMTVSAPAGATRLEIANTLGFALGDTIRISPGAANEEDNVITGFGSFLLATPLKFPHGAGEPIVRIAGAGPGATPSATATATAPPPELVEPEKVDLACTTSVADILKLATLICSARISGDYTTTRWTVNGNVQNDFTGQTALFATYTQDTSAAIAVSACNRTACKSVATTQAVRFTPVGAATAIAAPPTPVPTPPLPPAQGVAVTCSRKFDQQSHAVIDCDALTTIAYTSVTWNITSKFAAFAPVTETDNHLTFEIGDAVADDDKGFANVDFQATVCSTAACEVSPPFRMPIPVANVTVRVLPGQVSMNNSVTLFAVISGGEAPSGGSVTFYDDRGTGTNQPIALEVPVNEFATFAAASLTVATGNYPLDSIGTRNIRARYHDGKNILGGAISKPAQLVLDPPADDVCDSINNTGGDEDIDENCQFTVDIGGGTRLMNVRVWEGDASSSPPTGATESVTVAPARRITVGGEVTVAPPDGAVDFCQNCLRQIYIGIGGNTASLSNRPPSPTQCVQVTIPVGKTSIDLPKVSFFVDATPGRYYLRATSSLQDGCGNPPTGGPETSVARVVVEGDSDVRICESGCSTTAIAGDGVTLTAAVAARPPASGVVTVGQVDFWESVDGGPERHIGFARVHNGVASTVINTEVFADLANSSTVGKHLIRAVYTDPGAGTVNPLPYFRSAASHGAYVAPNASGLAAQCTAPGAGCHEFEVLGREVTVGVLTSTDQLQLSQATSGSCLPTECVRISVQVSPSANPLVPLDPAQGSIHFFDVKNPGPNEIETPLHIRVDLGPQASASFDLYPKNIGDYATPGVVGGRTIRAKYCGTAASSESCGARGDFKSQASSDATVTFTGQATDVTLSMTPATRQLGAAATVGAAVSLTPGGYGDYLGRIELYEGATKISCAARTVADCGPAGDWLRTPETWTGSSTHTFNISFDQGLNPFGAGPHALHAVYVPATLSNYLTGRSSDQPLTVTPSTTTTTLAVVTSPVTVGATVALEATVTGEGFGDQNGMVEFRRDGNVIAQVPVTLTGATAVTATANVTFNGTSTPLSSVALPASPSTYQLTAHFLGGGNYAPSDSAPARDLKVDPLATTTTVSATKATDVCVATTGNPSLGDKVLLTGTVAVTTPPGARTIAGTVEFFDTSNGDRSLGTASLTPDAGGGTAALCITATTANFGTGAHSIRAAFTTGSGDHASSASVTPGGDAPVTIEAAATNLTVTSSSPVLRLSPPSTSACLAPDCVAVTANIAAGSFGPHTGYIQFFDQTAPGQPRIATVAIVNQSAVLELRTSLPGLYPADGTLLIGDHTISARYCPATNVANACLPGGNYGATPASPPAEHTRVIRFEPEPTTADLTLSAATVTLGSATPITATVALTTGDYGPYRGTIELYDGSTPVYCAQRAPTVAEPAPPVCDPGKTWLRTDTWSANSTHAFSIGFGVGQNPFGAGSHSLHAVYVPAAQSNYLGATSANRALTVLANATTTSLAAVTSPITVGDAVTLVATVDGGAFGGQNGMVEFRRNGVAIAQVAVTLAGSGTVTGTASLTLDGASTPTSAAALPGSATAHSLTAHFLGAGNYAASTSSARSLKVDPLPTATVVTVSRATQVCVGDNGNPALGDKVILTATIGTSPLPGGRPISGSVEFFDTSNGNLSLGTAAPAPSWLGGAVNLCITATTANLATGTHTISATFTSTSGDYASSSSAADASVTIDAAPTILQLTTSSPAVRLGPAATGACLAPDCVAVTAVIRSGDFGAHSGYIQFFDQTAAGQPRLATVPVSAQQAVLEFRTGSYPAIYPTDGTLLTGDHTISARYCPATDVAQTACTATGNYQPTAAAPLPEHQRVITIQPQTTLVDLVLTPTSVNLGAATPVSAAVTLSPGGYGSYAGSIELMNGTTVVACVARVAAGACVAWPSGETAGHTFTLDFSTPGGAPLGGGAQALTARYTAAPATNYASGESSPRTLTVNPVGSTTALQLCAPGGASCTALTPPFIVGSDIDLVATVSAAGFGAATGTVEFRRGYVNAANPGTLLGSASASLSGTTTVTGKATLALRSTSTPKSAEALPADPTAYAITAHFLGGGSYSASQSSASNLTVNPVVTSISADATKATGTCTVATGSIILGEPVVLTAIIIGAALPGGRTVGGTVEFRDASAANALLGTATVVPNLAGGSATLCVYTSPTGVGAGTHAVSASFVSTSADYASSNSTTNAALVVEKITTATAVTLGATTVAEGGSLALSATVAPASGMPYVGALTGNVEFRAGYASESSLGTLLATAALSSNAASATVASVALSAGSHTVVARYVGDSSYNLSVSTGATLNVQRATTVAVTATPNPIGYGANLALQADVTGYVAGLGNMDASGAKVDFYRGATLLGTDTTGTGTGGARFTLTVDTDGSAAMTPGTYGITAVYSGNAAYATSTSAPIGVQVNAAATTLTINTGSACTGGNATIALAGTVDLCATLTPAGFGSPVANGGAVTFYVDGAAATGTVAYACGVLPLSACASTPMTAKITLTSSLTFLDGGSHFITAVYSGNSSYLPSSTASGVTVTVSPAPTAATVAFQAGFTSPLVVTSTGTAAIRVTVAPSPTIAYSPTSGTVVLYESPSGTGGWSPIAVSNTYDSLTGSWLFNVGAGVGQPLLPGNHFLAAQFLGNTDFAASPAVSGPGTQLQVQLATTVAITFSVATPIPNSTAFTISATLTPGGFGNYFTGASCGTVVFNDVTSGAPVLIGTATFTAPNLYTFSVPNTRFTAAGARTIRATYNGCGAYAPGSVDQAVTFS